MMKRFFTIVAALSLPAMVFAQSQITAMKPTKRLSAPSVKTQFTGEEKLPPMVGKSTQNRNAQEAIGRQIGHTFYDLQSNGSVARRLMTLPNGEITAVWTFSDFFAGSSPKTADYTDRGSGYNHFSAGEWNDFPVKRIEATRTGWPNICMNALGEEVVIAHAVTPSSATRAVSSHLSKKLPTSTTWKNTINSIPGNAGRALWHRSASIGDTVFVINSADSARTADASGLKTPVFYSRSINGGKDWVEDHTTNQKLAGWDTTNYVDGPGADAYSIDARGTTVAIIIGGTTDDLALWKSTDRGETFTRTVIYPFPIKKYNGGIYDSNNDGIRDTLLGVDQHMSVAIDKDGNVHVAYGVVNTFNRVNVPDSLNIFFENSINYWNDKAKVIVEQVGFAPSEADPTMPDDGTSRGSGFTLARYGNGGSAIHPSIAVDNDNNPYITYSAITPGDTSDESTVVTNYGANFRNIFGVKSTDGGLTFSTPVNITNTTAVENVFACLNRDVTNGVLSILFQRDSEPGTGLQADGHPSVENEIVYAQIDVTTWGEIKDGIANKTLTGVSINAFPNPAQNSVKFTVNSNKAIAYELTIINTIGQVLKSEKITSETTVNVSDLPNGMYFYTLRNGNESLTQKLVINK